MERHIDKEDRVVYTFAERNLKENILDEINSECLKFEDDNEAVKNTDNRSSYDKMGLDKITYNINGYYNEETSHLAVASTVGRGDANIGLGNKKASMQVETIDFIPLQTERYDLIIKKSDLNNPIYKSIISILSSEKFKNELQGIGGYDLKDLGKIISTT